MDLILVSSFVILNCFLVTPQKSVSLGVSSNGHEMAKRKENGNGQAGMRGSGMAWDGTKRDGMKQNDTVRNEDVVLVTTLTLTKYPPLSISGIKNEGGDTWKRRIL